jgi:hypothetical protein
MKTTIISHFFNEEYLLPWWLEHHTRIFDHGILIDYGSTDRSVEICRRLAPHWEVRPSRNQFFDARLVDEEVMDIERTLEGWKIALNVTEFFVCRDMILFKWALNSFGSSMYGIRAVLMADPPGHKFTNLDDKLPLVSQRHFGFFEDEKLSSNNYLRRSRFFYIYPSGSYLPGRHQSNLPVFMHPPGALILWFGFSPWVKEMKARMLQIQSKIPESDKKLGYGVQHLVDEQKLEQRYLAEAAKTENLLRRPEYERLLSGWTSTINRVDKMSQLRPSEQEMEKVGSSIDWDFNKATKEKEAADKRHEKLFFDYEFWVKKAKTYEKELNNIHESMFWKIFSKLNRFKSLVKGFFLK